MATKFSKIAARIVNKDLSSFPNAIDIYDSKTSYSINPISSIINADDINKFFNSAWKIEPFIIDKRIKKVTDTQYLYSAVLKISIPSTFPESIVPPFVGGYGNRIDWTYSGEPKLYSFSDKKLQQYGSWDKRAKVVTEIDSNGPSGIHTPPGSEGMYKDITPSTDPKIYRLKFATLIRNNSQLLGEANLVWYASDGTTVLGYDQVLINGIENSLSPGSYLIGTEPQEIWITKQFDSYKPDTATKLSIQFRASSISNSYSGGYPVPDDKWTPDQLSFASTYRAPNAAGKGFFVIDVRLTERDYQYSWANTPISITFPPEDIQLFGGSPGNANNCIFISVTKAGSLIQNINAGVHWPTGVETPKIYLYSSSPLIGDYYIHINSLIK